MDACQDDPRTVAAGTVAAAVGMATAAGTAAGVAAARVGVW